MPAQLRLSEWNCHLNRQSNERLVCKPLVAAINMQIHPVTCEDLHSNERAEYSKRHSQRNDERSAEMSHDQHDADGRND